MPVTRLPKEIEEVDGAWLGQALHEDGRIRDPAGVSVTAVKPVPGGTAWSTSMAILELDGPEGTPESAVVKLPIEGELRQLLDGIGAYVREVTFYKRLAKSVPVRVPEPYVVRMEEDSTDFVLVMEDLSGLQTPDQITGLTLEEARAAVDALGAFHAWGWEHERLHDLEQEFPPLDGEKAAAIYGQFTKFFVATWQKVRDLPAVTNEARTIGDRFEDLMPFFVERLSTPRTLAHGELRADNFFLLGDGELLMVDFQSLAQQAGITDVAYLVSQSVDEEVRRGQDEALVRRYQETLAANGVSDYTFEQAWEQYQIAVAFMLMIPVLAFIQEEHSDDRGKTLMLEMLARACDTIVSVGSLDRLPSAVA